MRGNTSWRFWFWWGLGNCHHWWRYNLCLGWDYQLQYLQSPKQWWIWLQSLRISKTQQPPKQKKKSWWWHRPNKFGLGPLLSRTLECIQDDHKFKSFGISIYKSFIFPTKFGGDLQSRFIKFDFWDQIPNGPVCPAGSPCINQARLLNSCKWASMSNGSSGLWKLCFGWLLILRIVFPPDRTITHIREHHLTMVILIPGIYIPGMMFLFLGIVCFQFVILSSSSFPNLPWVIFALAPT